MAAPDSMVVEVEFTAGVWTDVTAYVDWSAGGSIRYGRTAPFGAPQVASLNLTLDNTDGRFSPGREVLADGTTAHPYYPDVRPRRRIRLGVVVSAVTHILFTGFVKGWPQSFKTGIHPRVVISASDLLDRLARVELKSPIRHEVEVAAPDYSWPMTDAAGSTMAVEASGRGAMLVERYTSGVGTVTYPDEYCYLTLGEVGPGVGDGTGAKWTFTDPHATGTPLGAEYLHGRFAFTGTPSAYTIEGWFQLPAGTFSHLASVDDPAGNQKFSVTATATNFAVSGVALILAASPITVRDETWHHFAAVIAQSGPTTSKLYIDGAVVAASATTETFPATGDLYAGGRPATSSAASDWLYNGSLGYFQLYGRELSVAEIAAHAGATTGFDGETVDERIARALGYADLTASDWMLDASAVTCGTYPQDGKSVAQMCHDGAETEGGGSVFYVHTDGKARFKNRDYRSPTTPTLTVDAAADLYGDPFASSYDEDTIVTDVTGNRATSSGIASSLVVSDTDARDEFGSTSGSFTSYSDDDDDVLHVAQDRLAQQHEPGYRLPKITVDPLTGTTPGLWAGIAATSIGDRLRVTNVPANAAPRSTVDGIVEGWSIDWSDATFYASYDTSPADNPARGVWESTTYGKWGCDGQTLSTALADGATTTVVIASAAGKPTFTTSAAAYPVTIRIGEEDISLNSAPSGAASPQTFTGVTRGANGTGKAAHVAGLTVTLAPTPTWSI